MRIERPGRRAQHHVREEHAADPDHRGEHMHDQPEYHRECAKRWYVSGIPLHASLIVEQFTLTCELVSIKQRSGQRTKTSALTPSLPTKRALPGES